MPNSLWPQPLDKMLLLRFYDVIYVAHCQMNDLLNWHPYSLYDKDAAHTVFPLTNGGILCSLLNPGF